MRWIILCMIVVYGCRGLIAGEFEEYQAAQKAGIAAISKGNAAGITREKASYGKWKQMDAADFERWQAQRDKEYAAFRATAFKIWGGFKEPSPRTWVEYAQNAQSVSTVAFDSGIVTVDVLISPGELESLIRERLEAAIVAILSSRGSTSAAPVSNTGSNAVAVMDAPVLLGQVMDFTGRQVTEESAAEFAAAIVSKGYQSESAGGNTQKAEVTFLLVPDHLRIRMQPYLAFVQKYAERYDLDPSLVLATIHVESYFNPMARSSCNAMGLMQLVPTSGGKEAFQFLSGGSGYPDAFILFDPEKNIELGCAYQYLLKNRYFGGVNDENSREYCTVAAYNTGPGNVAKAFVGSRDIPAAVEKANAIGNAPAVFDFLVRELQYSETRAYLRNVSEKIRMYSKVQ